MKAFYDIHEPWVADKTVYMEKKRETVLKTIKPICEAFEIIDYDYVCSEEKERLIIEGTEIGCRCNSIGATVRELITYLFVVYAADKIGAFNRQTLNQLKSWWIKDYTDNI